MKTTTEKLGIDKGSKVRVEVCDSNGKITEIVEGNVLRIFPHNIVLDEGAVITYLEEQESSTKRKSYTIPMRWIKSIEETK